MATSGVKQNNLNSISGRVTLKGTNLGVEGVLIVLYDLDTESNKEDSFATPASTSAINQPQSNQGLGDRIGSVITDHEGSWSLSYEDSEFRILNTSEKRPDILLMVVGPEDADSDKPPVILFRSKVLRVNSGRIESYIIRLTNKQLIEADIPVPTQEKPENNAENKINKFRDKKTAQKTLKEGIKLINKEFEDADREEIKLLRKSFKDAILPNAEIQNSMYNFVKETQSIKEVQHEVFNAGQDQINSIINNVQPENPVPGKGIKINLILTEADKEELTAQGYQFTYEGNNYFNIPELKIREILLKRENDDGINAILFSNNPISKYCIQKSADEKCAVIHTGIKPDVDDHDHPADTTPETTPPAAEGISNADIPFYLEKILAGKNSDQFQNNIDYKSQRPDDKSVQANVDNFTLQKGPADTTAFYDFHSLQIAFQHVWQHLLDETLVNLGEQIHREQENTGRKGILEDIKEKLEGDRASGSNMVVSTVVDHRTHSQDEIPVEISSAFDITFLEYDALTADSKEQLKKLATEINDKEDLFLPVGGTRNAVRTYVQEDGTIVHDHRGVQESSTNYSGHELSTYISVIRDRGERIIDNVRINKPFTTNQLLKELQERLLAKYEFTVFAADRNYHSVNFGIMNTFRQKWEPISYQAGKLIKTIPLSPKEERKYSVKTTQNIKTTKKQALKNNSALTQEINTTSRAESEIIAKAHDKSNFNLSVKLDYSKITSEMTFGKEAEKESSQAKKDFRESVIKAAQEFKEERSVEIDTEETINSEYNESGTIVNPNDELSVTYLFYELQRRYRISEQLYRVMPVVLVAQEVPSPDEITEAWIIAHDWILNRALLDDSFRNTLQYLAQKNVGDDFAIRELRKNLRQQRTLVNNLQVEFAKLQTEVDNKYASLQSSTSSRIGEEHDKRFFKWWWWWGTNNQAGSPPDPEMAKAIEQAAADDHKHAVEQAERLSLSVQREVNALHQLTSDYNVVMREHLDRITQTRRLLTHVKENILYYMQAIWSMEPPDQRFMRLYKVKIPQFEAERTCIIQDTPVEDFFAQFREEGKLKHVAWLHGTVSRDDDDSTEEVTYKQLVEVADVDTMLGFKGNYMIFPLKEHNALTELMAAPYIDEAFGAMDPDQLSNINLEEFSKYICCLHHEDPAEFERLKDVLKYWLGKLLADPLRNGDEIIIPTGSMFMEMLPSSKSLLEDFKLKHREWDVYKVQAEVRKLELENIRYAARVLNLEREDPDIEKKIVVEGKTLVPSIDVES